jgi:hypothetical protein
MNGLRSCQPGISGMKSAGDRQLDVHLELFLQPRHGAEEAIRFRDDRDVGVDRARSPAQQHRGRTAGEVDAGVDLGLAAELGHEAVEALPV